MAGQAKLPKSAMATGAEDGLPTFEEFGKQVAKEEEVISNLLRTKDGEIMMKYLARRYDGTLVARVEGHGVDEVQTSINIGAREVYVHLRGLKGTGGNRPAR